MNTVLQLSLWIATLGSAMMAGVYFAFSAFVMRALGAISRQEGMSAMQSINDVILSSAFMPLFFGTSLLGLGLAGASGLGWTDERSWSLAMGGLLYVLGMLLVTVVFNVPLNEALKAMDPASAGAAELWQKYLDRWTFWNHLRTLASLGASALFLFALTRQG